MTDAEIAEALQKRLEDTEAALQRCERISVASRYAGAIMHEVNNPLAAITNLVYLTRNQSTNPQKVEEYMSLVERQLKTLAAVTKQVLAFHREQASAKDFDIIDLTESALKLHNRRLTAGAVALIRDFRPPAVASVFGSEILQVVSNLLLNSLDALPQKNAKLRIRIESRNEAVHITISDNGSGMSPETLKNLFQPHMTTKSTGTGLGLWLSDRIVKKHRGKLTVRSSQAEGRRGTTFRLFRRLTEKPFELPSGGLSIREKYAAQLLTVIQTMRRRTMSPPIEVVLLVHDFTLMEGGALFSSSLLVRAAFNLETP